MPLTSLSLLGPLALFALVSSITPGPNNVMLATSGLNFGFRRTIPHLLGVSIGFTLMVFLVGVGLGSVFQQVPALYTVLKHAGAAYLLYLAWKIANAGEMKDGVSRARPMTFLQAAAFQWVNPKAWVMAVGIIATYTPQASFFANLVIATVVCGLVNLPSVGVGSPSAPRCAASCTSPPRFVPSTSAWRCCWWPRCIRWRWTCCAETGQ